MSTGTKTFKKSINKFEKQDKKKVIGYTNMYPPNTVKVTSNKMMFNPYSNENQ